MASNRQVRRVAAKVFSRVPSMVSVREVGGTHQWTLSKTLDVPDAWTPSGWPSPTPAKDTLLPVTERFRKSSTQWLQTNANARLRAGQVNCLQRQVLTDPIQRNRLLREQSSLIRRGEPLGVR